MWDTSSVTESNLKKRKTQPGTGLCDFNSISQDFLKYSCWCIDLDTSSENAFLSYVHK